jgi:hypothetical protein
MPFFLNVWMEIAEQNHGVKTTVKENKTLFFIPSNDDRTGAKAAQETKKQSQE